jgi:hypothetical protein
MLAIIVIVVVIALLAIWYKKRTRRLFLQMEIMSTIANLVVLFKLTEKISPDGTYADLDKVWKPKLAAICNYLFGHDFNPMHLEQFSPEYIKTAALQYLDSDDALREIVVQSLRVNKIVYFHKARKKLEGGMEILIGYGKQFPDSPVPEPYFQLVMHHLRSLNEKNRNSILQHVASTWPNFFRQRMASSF